MGASESLWAYATRVYASPPVARACLRAQDDLGLDVNILLFAAWLADRGYALASAQVAAAEELCSAWRSDVVKPLRRTRRAWREAPPNADAYEAIKGLELEAERHQLSFLESLGHRLVGAGPTRDAQAIEEQSYDLLRGNLVLAAGLFESRSFLDDLVSALKAVD